MDKKKQKNVKKEWKPDPKVAEILIPFFDMGLSANATSKQGISNENKEITGIRKMPNLKTIFKYWNYWKKELVEQQMSSLAEMQRSVKAFYLNSYDKQLLLAESQIQGILAWKETEKKEHETEMKILAEKGKNDEIFNWKPDVAIETLLARLNEMQGDMKLAKAQLEGAPIVDQISEDSTLRELEEEQERNSKKFEKLKGKTDG